MSVPAPVGFWFKIAIVAVISADAMTIIIGIAITFIIIIGITAIAAIFVTVIASFGNIPAW